MAIRVKNAKLFLDFTWQHVRCKEYTGLADTPENRRRCERKMEAIDREIARGVFDYRRHFPDGSRLHVFHPDAQPTGGMTFQTYILRWYKMRSPFRTDGTLARDAALHPSTWLHDEHTIRKHFLPAFGPLRLDEIAVTRINEFRRSLVDSGLAGKTVTTIMGLLHKAFADALEENLIDENPVRRIASRRQIRLHQRRTTSDPLTPAEVARYLAAVPEWYRDLYSIWFRLGWRPSEIVALRLGWLDFDRQIIALERGRIARWGGIEAAPKTGPREVDCSYDPEIFRALRRLRDRAAKHGAEDFVFTDAQGNPLSQEWLHKRIWKAALARAGLRVRGQYNIRDTFITIALSAGEDPGWVARVCGTSEQMIFQHYRRWIPGLQTDAGRKVGRVLGEAAGDIFPPAASPGASPSRKSPVKSLQNQLLNIVEAGGIEALICQRSLAQTSALSGACEIASAGERWQVPAI